MNIQIFGRTKCFDTKNAERFFKERQIKFQYIDIDSKGMSPGELQAVLNYLKNVDTLIDKNSRAYETLHIAFVKRSLEDLKELLLENPKLFATPIVRNGKLATVGLQKQIWQTWIDSEN